MINCFLRVVFLMLTVAIQINLVAAQSNASRGSEGDDVRQLINARQIALIEQIGQSNLIDLQQIGGAANKAVISQNGRRNTGIILLSGGMNNQTSLHQSGNRNKGEIRLSDGIENTISVRQENNLNRLEINLGRAEDVNLRIKQHGEGFISLDIPDYRSYSNSNLDLRRATINQSNGGVPIIIRPGRGLNLPSSRNSGGN